MPSYGAIHFRNVNRAALLRETEKLASLRNLKLLIGPELNGWTTLYPAPHGQDGTVATTLAKILDASVLHLLVHKNAFFAYRYYRGAEFVHGYNTRPEYFDDESAPVRRPRVHGTIDSLRQLSGPELRLTAIVSLLSNLGRVPIVELDHLARFAEILGIQNAATSYEQLVEGDLQQIVAWDQFITIPVGDAVTR